MGNNILRIRLVVLLLILSSMAFAGEAKGLGVHYELDMQYHYPGDSGYLLLVATNDGSSNLVLFGAFMNVSGIGNFTGDLSNLTLAAHLPSGAGVYQFDKGATLRIQIPFMVPANATPSDYSYKWSIVYGESPSGGIPMAGYSTLSVLASGEQPPPPPPPSPFLILLVLLPVLLVAYPFVRWKNKKLAKLVGIAAIIVFILDALLGGGLFIALALGFVIALFPIVALLAIIFFVASAMRRRKCEAANLAKPSAAAQKVRTYAKSAALIGLLFAVACIILGPFLGGLMDSGQAYLFPFLHEHQNAFAPWISASILVTIASAIIWIIAGAFKQKHLF